MARAIPIIVCSLILRDKTILVVVEDKEGGTLADKKSGAGDTCPLLFWPQQVPKA